MLTCAKRSRAWLLIEILNRQLRLWFPMANSEEIEIGEEIDSGLYGRVYKGTQTNLGRTVAVKVVTGEIPSKDALEHAKALTRISGSPEVVTVFAVQDVNIPGLGSVPAIIMEWVEGKKIGDRFAGERFTEDEAYVICTGVLKGIRILHEGGVCHGDLHWGNVLITDAGQPKIIDVDVNKDVWLSRMSSHSKTGAVQSDVNYCRDLIYRVLSHSQIRPAKLTLLEEALSKSESLLDLMDVVQNRESVDRRLAVKDILEGHELRSSDAEVLKFSGEFVAKSDSATTIVPLAELPNSLSDRDVADAVEVLSQKRFVNLG